MTQWKQYVNPALGELLGALNLDKRFVRGEGTRLWDEEGREYLDFIAAYGALPFGFNPPAIWSAIQAIQTSAEPSFVQPSDLRAAGELAERLVALAPEGIKYVWFANSGTEAVEAALKLVRIKTGKLGIISTHNSFHGKTLGALSATGNDGYQKGFGAPIAGFNRVTYGDLGALEAILDERADEIAAVILEPIQGEGGIIVPPAGYLAGVRELCNKHGVLLILDEIQAGLGRTGTLFACEQEGVIPDVITIAKALGGGIVPVGAVLYNEAAYSETFATKHSSTFAGNTLACRVGLASLTELTKEGGALLQHVSETGAHLLAGLQAVGAKYPHVVKAVRGRGYMIGVEVGCDMNTWGRTSLLGVMAEQESLTPVLSSYLLNVEGIRVAPTLNGAAVIRIEPPLIATKAECDRVIAAFDRTLAHLAKGNTAELVGHLMGVESRPQILPAPTRRVQAEPTGESNEGRFAFLVHPVDLRNYPEMDQSLSVLSLEEIGTLTERFYGLLEPFVAGSTRIAAEDGSTAYGEFVVVPYTADQLMAMNHADAVEAVRKASDLARDRGAQIVGLGAYTSVVTRGGLHLRNPGVAITTGNSYTVVSAVESIYKAVSELGTLRPATSCGAKPALSSEVAALRPTTSCGAKPALSSEVAARLDRSSIAVVGATGAIGRSVAMLLAEQIERLILIGNPSRPEMSRKRLLKVAGDAVRLLATLNAEGKSFAPGTIGAALVEATRGNLPDPHDESADWAPFVLQLETLGHLVITTEIDTYLPQADLVVTATSSTEDLVTPQNLKMGAAVCDLSRPPNVSRAVKEARPDVLVIDGGVVAVPGRPDLGWNFGFEQGLAYACMAETMLLGLSQRYEDTSIGTDLNLETILWLRSQAERMGFELAQLRSFDRPFGREDWERLRAHRQSILQATGAD
ncbi:MAG TPA: aminotransferase class III-fold pyridoxal phosphate-dependent enzyme [Symbiobacteriaceae bacterium]|nr:aminotransferase class III-fold pyridoxal phosphate-dependent enzyme [Symbiobacteriaceae bacterium]